MITRTSLNHPITLENIKKAILIAVKRAATDPTGVYIFPVWNRKGVIYLAVIAVKNKGYKIQNSDYYDVTETVNEALRKYHS